MSKLNDLSGKRFGELVVVERDISKKGTYWRCKCSCGNMTSVKSSNLTNDSVKSCGCLRHRPHQTHHLSKHPLYNVWYHMKRRCYDPKHPFYKNYGARGISICDEWHDFENFYKWAMDNGYEKGLSIDRIDNDGEYSPENCRLVKMDVQANNRSSCRMFTYNGKTQNLMQWCKELGLNYKRVYSRVFRNNWDFERAITEPLDERYQERKKNGM